MMLVGGSGREARVLGLRIVASGPRALASQAEPRW